MKVTTRVPLDIGAIHFIGIGGIGMSGIAEIMHNLGYKVQGSDVSESANVKRLKAMGIAVSIGHSADNLKDAHAVVYSSAVKPGNVEFDAARALSLPLVRRAEMLAEIMRLRSCVAIAGTNGKTTTTTLVAALLDGGGMDPTVVNGGIINAYGTNARLGAGEWVVVEADESDGTFLRLPATIAVVTNIDPEHMDFYGDFGRVKAAFQTFVQSIPFYGFAAMCIHNPEVQSLLPQLSDRKIITYGLSPNAMVRGLNVVLDMNGVRFDAAIADRVGGGARVIENIHVTMYGQHNVLNSLAAVAVAAEMGLSDDVIREGLARFKGVKRRFTKTGEAGGITVIDDYGHHPVEIAAVLKAARQAGARDVIAVVQPHRYTRLAALFEDFCTCMNDAGTVIIADVYAAGEAPIEGMDKDGLVEGLRARGHRSVVPLPGPDSLAEMVHAIAKPGDFVICLGAGSITTWAHALPEQLTALQPGARVAPMRRA